MPLLQLHFNEDINSEISIGDLAYYCAISTHLTESVALGKPQLIGVIQDIDNKHIVVDSVFASFNIIGKFILFSKPITVEESGLKGYYANVTLENNSKTPIELFAVSSEAIVSSK